MNNDMNIEISIATMRKDISYIIDQLDDLKETMKNDQKELKQFATKKELGDLEHSINSSLSLWKKAGYTIVMAIVLSNITALLTLILKKGLI